MFFSNKVEKELVAKLAYFLRVVFLDVGKEKKNEVLLEARSIEEKGNVC